MSSTTPENNPRVLIGLREIAWNVRDFSAILSAEGVRVTSVIVPVLGDRTNPADYTHYVTVPDSISGIRPLRVPYRMLQKLFWFLRLVPRHDVFVYVWNTTFLPWKLDYPLLRLFGRKVVVFHCGDDVRYRPIQYHIDRELRGEGNEAYLTNADGQAASFWRTFWSQRLAEMFASAVVTIRNQATFQSRECYLFRFPTRAVVPAPKKAAAIPLIVHAPSSRAFKGTQYVIEAIALLHEKGLRFEYEEIAGRENVYVLQRLAAADIVVDQPGTWIGKLAAEGLAAGCVVIGGNSGEYEGYPDQSPVLPFEPSSEKLAETLAGLIGDPERREGLMRDSYLYWKSCYSPKAWVTFFRQVLEGTAPVLKPLPEHKARLLKFASSALHRGIIRLFYHD